MPHTVPRVLIAGYYGFGNTGDEVILGTMVSDLRRLRPGLAISVTTATPAETAAAHRVDPVIWCDMVALEAAAAASDLVIIGGGGLFFDTFGFDPSAFLTNQHTGIGFYTAPAVLGALHGKPVMLYAVGVGPLITDDGRRFTRLACQLADVVTVRDPRSREILVGTVGVPSDKVTLTADPAFGYVPAPGVETEVQSSRPQIAVSVRPWDTGVSQEAWERTVVVALDGAVERRNAHVVFVPFQHLPGRPEDDGVVAERFRARMRHPDRARVLDSPSDPATIYATLAASDVIVGVRLHSLVLGLLARVPVVALNYDPKVGQLMERLGLGAFLLDLPTLSASMLLDRIERAMTPDEDLRRTVDREVTRLTAFAGANAVAALELLDGGSRTGGRWDDASIALLPDEWRARVPR